MASHAVHSVLFNADLLGILLEFDGRMTLAAVCLELKTLTGKVKRFTPSSGYPYLFSAKLRSVVRARLAHISKQLYLSVGDYDIQTYGWQPEFTELLNEAASCTVQVFWDDVDKIPWKDLSNVVKVDVWSNNPDVRKRRSLAFLRDLPTLKRLLVCAAEVDLREVACLKELETLRLETIFACSNSANALAGMPKLQELHISFCRSSCADFIGLIPSLRRIYFHKPLVDCSILENYTNLQKVALTGSSVSPFQPSSLRNCKNIIELYLSETQVSDISVLKYFPVLRYLIIKDFAPLSAALCLRKLNLAYTNFSDLGILASLPHLSNLNCNRSSVTSLEQLKNFRALEKLSIRYCKVESYDPLYDLYHALLVEADIFNQPTLVGV